MNKFITNLYGHGAQSTAMMAQHMMVNIAKKEGYSEIAVGRFNPDVESVTEMIKRVEGMITAVESEDMVIVQLPTWRGVEFDKILVDVLRDRVKKMAIFIHDFIPLMFENNRYLMKDTLDSYNKSDLVIVPSAKMGDQLIEEGLCVPYMIQGIWDHLSDGMGLTVPKFEKKIKFAGNMTRFPFVKKWKGTVPLEVYGDQVGEIQSDNVVVKGWMYDHDLIHSLNKGGFGLVWSENIDNQSEREYSTMNASSKFSAYLAAGIPIIVNRGLAKQDFVEQQGIGLVADSLEEVNNFVENITPREYSVLVQNVDNISKLVRKGFFARKLLIDVQDELFLKQ